MLVLDSVLTWSGALDDRKQDGQAIHWVRRHEKLMPAPDERGFANLAQWPGMAHRRPDLALEVRRVRPGR